MTAADKVNGGDGVDQIALQGNYSGGLTFGANVLDVENLAIMPGNDTRFGDSGVNFYDYNLTLLDVNVAAGVRMIVDANRLRVGEDFTFNGTLESDGSFFIYGGGGTDNLTGGAGKDVFLFGAQGQWGSSDVLNGGGGVDQLALRGDYNVTFGAGQLTSIESIGLVSAFDTRFGALGDTYDYNLTMNDGNVALGVQMTVDAAPLRATESLTFNGSAENDGTFRVFGGLGNDVITGGKGNDIIVGNLGSDTMTGGLGLDKFVYRSKDDSTSGGADGIQDFTTGDILDLSQVDAIDGGATNDAFTFINGDPFNHVAGELRATVYSGPIWLVEGDTDGDGDADLYFFVTVTDASPITSGDFML
jgi:Ca2+-binding RTX toxin-like protein